MSPNNLGRIDQLAVLEDDKLPRLNLGPLFARLGQIVTVPRNDDAHGWLRLGCLVLRSRLRGCHFAFDIGQPTALLAAVCEEMGSVGQQVTRCLHFVHSRQHLV